MLAKIAWCMSRLLQKWEVKLYSGIKMRLSRESCLRQAWKNKNKTFIELNKTTACSLCPVSCVTVCMSISCTQNVSKKPDVKPAPFTSIYSQVSTEVVQSISTRWNCEFSSVGVISENTKSRQGEVFLKPTDQRENLKFRSQKATMFLRIQLMMQ